MSAQGQRVLGLVQEHDVAVNALVYTDADAAHMLARDEDPPGERVAVVKDNIAVRGAPWACGSATRRDEQPAHRDAEVVRRLRAAGAVVLGTTNMDEFAMGASTESSSWGPTRNPWDLARSPGGSSGGSAAAAAAYGVLALGTDTGGSIREPASQCGVVGVKPTHNAISVDCVVPFAPSLDDVGPIAPDVAGAAWLHDVLAGTGVTMAAAAEGGRSRGVLHGQTVGIIAERSGARNASDVVSRFDAACALMSDLGAKVTSVSLPHSSDALRTYYILSSVEALMVLESHALSAGLGVEALHRLTQGRGFLGTAAWEDARAAQDLIREDLAVAFEECDLLASPTMPLVAPLLGRTGVDDPLAVPRTDWWTVEANLAGIPAMSLPCGLGAETGLPVGLQLMAPAHRDAELYRTGAALETGGLAPLRPPLD